jgi:hypothetical protein
MYSSNLPYSTCTSWACIVLIIFFSLVVRYLYSANTRINLTCPECSFQCALQEGPSHIAAVAQPETTIPTCSTTNSHPGVAAMVRARPPAKKAARLALLKWSMTRMRPPFASRTWSAKKAASPSSLRR